MCVFLCLFACMFSLCVSTSVYVCLCLSMFADVCVRLSASICVYLHLSESIYVYLCLSMFIYVCSCLFMSILVIGLSMSIYVCLCLSMSLSLSMYVYVYPRLGMHVTMRCQPPQGHVVEGAGFILEGAPTWCEVTTFENRTRKILSTPQPFSKSCMQIKLPKKCKNERISEKVFQSSAVSNADPAATKAFVSCVASIQIRGRIHHYHSHQMMCSIQLNRFPSNRLTTTCPVARENADCHQPEHFPLSTANKEQIKVVLPDDLASTHIVKHMSKTRIHTHTRTCSTFRYTIYNVQYTVKKIQDTTYSYYILHITYYILHMTYYILQYICILHT